MAAPSRFLIIRFSSIGDILLTTPLVRAVRSRYPEAHLAYLTKPAMAPLVRDNPRLNEVLTLGEGESLAGLAGRLRAGRFTHLLDLHGSLRTRVLRALVPGRWRGYRHHRFARRVLIRTHRNLYPRDLPVPERYFDAVHDLGIRPDGDPPEFWLSEEERQKAGAWLGPEHGGLRIALAPGAAHNTKRWPVESWIQLAGFLAGLGHEVVVVGGALDRPAALEVARAAGDRGRSAAGEFGLQGTGAVLAQCRLLITGDTGVMHMATGVGTPVLALFGPTVRAFGFFPYARSAVVLERELACRPCTAWGSRQCPLGHHRCLREITVTEVGETALRMLA